MTAPLTLYFHTPALRQRFIDDLDEAVLAQRITSEDRRWLLPLADPATHAQPGQTPPRVDRLLLEDGSPTRLELAAALLFSDPAQPDRGFYLSTLLHGVERFTRRESLLAALQQRFGGAHPTLPAYEYEKLDSDPFAHRTWAILEQQVRLLSDQITHLKSLPSLRTALSHALKQQFETLEPGVEVDLSNQLLQIREAGSPPGAVRAVHSLLDEAYDQLTGRAVPSGSVRYFLDSRGAALDHATSARYAQALAGAVSNVNSQYPLSLADYWDREGLNAARREYFTGAIHDVFLHELHRRRHDGTLSGSALRRIRSMLSPAEGRAEDGTAQAKKLVLTLTDGKQMALAGAFLISDVEAGADVMLMYTPAHGLRRINRLQSAIDHFAGAEGLPELLPYLSLDEQTALQAALQAAQESLSITVQPLQEPLFDAQIEAITALQGRNLKFALGLPLPARGALTSMLDDALDVRRLLDARLLPFGAGRWLPGGNGFDLSPGYQLQTLETDPEQAQIDIDSASARLTTRLRESSPWVERLHTLDHEAAHVQFARPDIESMAHDALNAWLAVLGTAPLDPSSVVVQLDDEHAPGGDKIWIALIDLLCERVTGYRKAALDNGVTLHLKPAGAASPLLLTHLPIGLIDQVLTTIAKAFESTCVTGVSEFFSGTARHGGTQIFPEPLCTYIREGMLRLELAVEQRVGALPQNGMNQFNQVLDYPERAQRAIHGLDRVEVYELSVVLGAEQPPVLATNAFVLRRPAQPDSPLAVWSAARGLRCFDSVQALEHDFNHQRQHPGWSRWLTLFNDEDLEALAEHLDKTHGADLQLQLSLIEGHFIRHLQQGEQRRQAQALQHLLRFAERCRFDGPLLRKTGAAIALDDVNVQVLEDLEVAVDGAAVNALLPSWIATVQVRDLLKFDALITSCVLIMGSKPDYLFDIPTLEEYAQQRLQDRLTADFPDQTLDPDGIQITFMRRIAAPATLGEIPSMLGAGAEIHHATLSEFAITRFNGKQNGQLSAISLDDGKALPALTHAYLQSLVDTLDIGGSYLNLLERKFDSSDPNYAARRAYFVELLPSLSLTFAFEHRLSGRISDAAYRTVEAVFEMPDSLARLRVEGQSMLISPLMLVAEPGASADVVPGFYVFCPADPAQGPVVLHSIYNHLFTFKEYTDLKTLLVEIGRDEALQEVMLQRMDAEAHKRYANGGFKEPHLTWSVESDFDLAPRAPAPPTLKIQGVQGNALQYMFLDNLRVLKLLAAPKVMTRAQARHKTLLFFMTLAVDQAIFVPGRVGQVASLLQGINLIQASVSSGCQQQWGKALSELSLALGMLIAARGVEEIQADESEGSAFEDDEAELEARFSWTHAVLTADQWARLRALAAQDVSLADLHRDNLLNLYMDSTAEHFYAAVAGKVYRVQATDNGWAVVGPNGEVGPAVKLDAQLRWQFDLRLGLKGGGAQVTRFRNSEMDSKIEMFFHVEASGMPQIRRQFRQKARAIGQAQLQAKAYLETTLDNLGDAAGAAPHEDVMRIIADFFGVNVPDQHLLTQIRGSTRTLYSALMDASLSTINSKRYVVGTNRIGHEKVCAFVVKGDKAQKIYLTERFFDIPTFALKKRVPGDPPFSVRSHYRAVTLIHELSHQVLDTRDIAYLEASAPFLDLLGEPNARSVKLKAALEGWQDRALSHLSERETLFQKLDNGGWRDLKHDDGGAKRRILQIAETDTLDAARDVFMDDTLKRSEIILANADSVALLMARLGRRKFVDSPVEAVAGQVTETA
ncbi:DUF6543 domain-containing protein [Xanthomonas sp. WHRI 1810A]|uniref:dermonecrotic toxin domain-containing protein n=1 Tax=Xanthomonas sp. WHRI 1810A TaxID=3161565 RepID=UPI0032E86945